MTQTHDFDLLGDTTFHCEWFRDDGADAFAGFGPEIRDARSEEEGIARLEESASTLAPLDPDERWWCRITKGTYEDSSFPDGDDGDVLDANWEMDEEYHQRYGDLVDGKVEWDG